MRPIAHSWLLAAVVVLAAGCTDTLPTEAPSGSESIHQPVGSGQAFTVYTQNLYLGGDTGPLFTLDLSDIPAVIAATQRFWAEVKASAIGQRMAAVVDEIDAERPHLVGVQEAVQFAVLDMAAGGTVIDFADLLSELEQRISARGLPYEVAAVQTNTTITLPLSPTTVLRAVERVAVLRRTDVHPSAIAQGTYTAFVPLGPYMLKRGWIRASTSHGGVPYHFITTHLETQRVPAVQAAQARQLIDVVSAGLDGVTIVAGDLNSDAANPGAPSWTPTYDAMLAAGFTDVWSRSSESHLAPGYTCCHPDLGDASDPLDQRLDFVLVRDRRSPERAAPGAFAMEIFGDEQSERAAGGLWAADHAGLIAALRLPGGLPN
jgi:endonuclease/exonuclease/phosphatase family metal-dependent hydrolase